MPLAAGIGAGAAESLDSSVPSPKRLSSRPRGQACGSVRFVVPKIGSRTILSLYEPYSINSAGARPPPASRAACNTNRMQPEPEVPDGVTLALAHIFPSGRAQRLSTERSESPADDRACEGGEDGENARWTDASTAAHSLGRATKR